MSVTSEYTRMENGVLCLNNRTSVQLRLSEKKQIRENIELKKRLERLETLLLEMTKK